MLGADVEKGENIYGENRLDIFPTERSVGPEYDWYDQHNNHHGVQHQHVLWQLYTRDQRVTLCEVKLERVDQFAIKLLTSASTPQNPANL